MSSLTSLPELLQRFFRVHLVAQRNVSPHTLRAYRDALVLLLRFAAARTEVEVADLEPDQLGRDVVLAFLDHLETTRRNSIRTRNARLAAIHSFFRFVAAEEPACALLAHKVLGIPVKRGPHSTVTCLDRAEVEQLLAAPDRRGSAGRRDVAMLWLLYNTGARAQEVVDLRIPAVRFGTPAQVRLSGKGRKERLCPLWPETVGLLREMLCDRGITEDTDAPLFLNATGHALTRFGLRHIVRECVRRAATTCPSLATRKISPHTFRHTTALHLLQSGVELNVVRSWLGHASIETTHAYVEIDLDMKRAALEATSPSLKRVRRLPWKEPGLLQWLEAL
jgi:site-specific recombinase XerD